MAEEQGKKWYKSKTVIVNGLVAVAAVVAEVYDLVNGGTLSGLQAGVAALAIVNCIFRVVTREAIKW